jgi:hypothetical protein
VTDLEHHSLREVSPIAMRTPSAGRVHWGDGATAQSLGGIALGGFGGEGVRGAKLSLARDGGEFGAGAKRLSAAVAVNS